MTPKLGETIFVHITTSDGDGEAAAADAAPSVEVFEDGTDAEILTLTSTAVTGKTGQYKAQIDCTSGNGFEADKSYNVAAAAMVGGVSGRSIVQRFQVRSVKPGEDSAGVTTLLSRLSSARAGYLDALNISGAVASHSDVLALNQSASRRLVVSTIAQMERPTAGDADVAYQVEARCYDGDGAAIDATGDPTITATNPADTDYSTNLSAANHVATGVYRWLYTVGSAHDLTQLRFDVSAALPDGTFTLSCFTLVCDFVAATWTDADRTRLTAIYDKLPSRSHLVGTDNLTGDVQLNTATGTPADSAGVSTLLARVPGTVQPQTGDAYARIGTPAGASTSADLAAIKAAIDSQSTPADETIDFTDTQID